MKQQRQPSQLIAFLQTQNKSLREDNNSFQELLELNRQALKIAIAPRQNQQLLPALVSLLFQQNSKLLAKNAHLRNQIQQKSCEALISQQIASASNQHEKYVACELKDRLKILRKQIESKDKLITDMQKQGQKEHLYFDSQHQSATGVIQYTDTTKVSEKMFKETQSLRKEIDLQSQQIFKYKQQKQELIKLNLILTKQVNELKAYSCQSTVSQKRDFNTSSSDLSKFLKYQSKIAQNSGDESEADDNLQSSDEDIDNDDEEYLQQEQQVSKKPPKFNLNLKPKQEQISVSKVQKNSKITLPKLELKKAKQIQNLIIKKINNDQKKKANNNPKDEKWKKLQIEVEEMRKKLGNQIIAKMKFQRQNTFLKKFIIQLQHRNQLLLREHRNENIEKDYQRQRQNNKQENMQSLLDICRDVTLNQKLRSVCKGKDLILQRKDIYSKQI